MLLPFWLSKLLKRLVAHVPEHNDVEKAVKHGIPVVFPVVLALVLTIIAVRVASGCHRGKYSWVGTAIAIAAPEIYLTQHYIHQYVLGDTVCHAGAPLQSQVPSAALQSQVSGVPALQ